MTRDVLANTAPPTMQIPRHTNKTMEQYRYLYQASWSPFKKAWSTIVPVTMKAYMRRDFLELWTVLT